jgi:hypothetical protein
MRRTGAKARSANSRRTAEDADIGGILRLLHAAHANLVLHFHDEPAASLLEQCIAVVAAHDPAAAQADSADEFSPAELNLTALVRMLVYVQAEVNQALRDAEASRSLQQCIDHLLHRQYFHRQGGFGRSARTSH